MTKQIHLAAHFPGVNHHTVWTDPSHHADTQSSFASFQHLAATAERGLFDFVFLAEGLRLREHRGRLVDQDVVGRPDTYAVLAALAGVTTTVGLAGTINATFNDPYELARQFATLDHLSAGRAAWNVVTSSDAFHGANFRRGGYLAYPDRYERAREVVEAARALWDAWAPDAIVADAATGEFVRPGSLGTVRTGGRLVDIEAVPTVPRPPQGHPVILQAGDSDGGRELAARVADAVFSRHSELADGQAFYTDVKGRLAAYGRRPEDLLILPAASFVLGDTAAEAEEKLRAIQLQQVRPSVARAFVEQVWNRDLSDHDVDGPLPTVDPLVDAPSITQGRASHFRDPLAIARQWRELSEAKGLSIRELVIQVIGRHSFVGTPQHVAAEIDRYVQEDASDGFILVPHLTPHGLDEFVDTVVPLLQERGTFRTSYEGSTLREHLGLPPADAFGRTLDADVRAS
ncbi:NtaA/DmoA family FMN-dependent monooxygenase [Cellulomonas sp. ICMP 17802]|uniref:NtaA/DmoA family FMN-dependent monooxygenase n=1 Tax=Cellulomonas sp. ICMP 17802 TaxID=3239199 RepID=UPI00351B9FC8